MTKVKPCPCECNGPAGFCGGCGHAGCSGGINTQRLRDRFVPRARPDDERRRFAYADPPYLGLCSVYGHEHGDGGCWDELETHRSLIQSLDAFDGWALSLTSNNLRDILPLTGPDVRVMAWVKPFASWKQNVWPVYAWEPLLVKVGRNVAGSRPTVTDWLACNITLQRGFTGAKPAAVIQWLCEVMGMNADDEFVDLFHGSGAVARAYDSWRAQAPLGLTP